MMFVSILSAFRLLFTSMICLTGRVNGQSKDASHNFLWAACNTIDTNHPYNPVHAGVKHEWQKAFWQRVCLPVYFLVGMMMVGVVGWGQTTLFSDNFNTNNSATWTTSAGAIGTYPNWNLSRSGADWGARVNSNLLELTNDASATTNVDGWAFGYRDINALVGWNTTLSSNTGVVTWEFNMRQIRSDPAGFNIGGYGVALILAGTNTNPATAGSGYAVVLGQSGSTDPLRLASYNNGLQGTLTNIITSNTSGLTDFGNQYLSIRITYNPSTNTWELLLRDDGTSTFTDPATGTLTSQGTAVNNTYTSTAGMRYIGGYWQGSTAANQTAFFDNVYLKITSSACTAPSTQASAITFSSVGSNSLNLNWTNGNGAGRVVIMNTTNSFTTPTNGSNPTANTIYSGSGEQVVFNGTGSGPISITGLTPGTTYHFRVYEYCSPDRTYTTGMATNNPSSQATTGPTNPTPQTLPYTQNFGTTSFTTYPAGFAGWNGIDGSTINTQALARASIPTGNATLTAQGSAFGSDPSGGLRGYATSANGRLAISSSNDNGDGLNQPVFAINTGAGNTVVTVAYDLEILYSGNRTQGMELEYRAGTSGSWTAVANSAVTYSSPTLNSITGYSFTVTGLTAATNYQFRWASWRNHGSGSSNSTIGIDNLVVTAGQPTFTEVFLPQFIQGKTSTNDERVPYAYRATLSNLLPNATYRYYNQVVTSSDQATTNGAGNCIFPVAAGAFTSTTNPSLKTTGNYGSFTTNASGSYTGWFISEPSGNARFAPGTLLNMRIMLNTSLSGSETEDYRLSSTNTVQVLGFAASAGANNGTAIRNTSGGVASNFVMLYDNTAGTGRPIAGTFVESDGTANTTGNNYASFYSTSVNGVAGAWGTIIPNTNANGVRRIEQFALSNGASVGCAATDADGTWPTGSINTVNPTGGTTTPLVIANADVTFVCPYVTSASDYFRSNVTTGNWTTPGSWQSSNDNLTWYTSTLAPTSAANTITIRTGHTIQVNTTVTLDQTIVIGKLEILNFGTLSLQDGSGDDLVIQNGGELNANGARPYNTEMNYTGSSTIVVQTGGKISIGIGIGFPGTGFDGFATRAGNTWQTGSIFEWYNAGAFAASGITYFPGAAVGTKPIFRVTVIGGTSPGGGSALAINGILEVNSNFTFIGAGAKTFRDGITGTATLTLDGGGTTSITSGAILGGSVTLVLNRTLNIADLEVPTGANVTILTSLTPGITKGTDGVLTVNGTLDITTVTITNTNGGIEVNGTLKTSRTQGLRGTGTNIASTVGNMIINDGSTIEYNANVDQSITTALNYYHLVLSGTGGTKTHSSASSVTINDNGSLTISGAVNVDAGSNNIGPASTTNSAAFTMNSTGTFTLSTTGSGRALPWMDGTYNVTSGIIRYNGNGQTIRNKAYQNIEVTGADVAMSNGNITLNSGGTFTVKSGAAFSINANSIVGPSGSQTVTIENGATFNCGNVEGLVGPTPAFSDPAAAIRDNIENIVLATGSTINYTRATVQQKITARSDYSNVIISGGGEKTVQGATTINGAFTLTDGPVIVGNNTLTLNGNLTRTNGTLTMATNSSLIFGTNATLLPLPNDVFTSAPPTFENLTINRAGGVTLGNQGITTTGALTLTAGTLSIGNNTLGINGGVTRTTGTLTTAAGSSLSFGTNAAALTLPNDVFAATPSITNITINRAGGVSLGNQGITATGALTLTTGAFSIGNNTLTLNGTLARTGGTLNMASNSSLTFGTNAALLALPNDVFTSGSPTFNNLTINRAGGVTLGNQGITTTGALTLTAGTLTVGNNTLGINGGLTRSTGNLTMASNSKLIFGANTGVLSLPSGIFSSAPTFDELTINRAGGVTLGDQPITLSGNLAMTNGILTTTTSNLITLGTAATATGGSNSSFVNGPLSKQVTAASPAFSFPVGKAGTIQPVIIDGMDNTGTFQAEFFPSGAFDSPRDEIILGSNFSSVWENKYWQVDRTDGSSKARVGLPYVTDGDSWSGPIPTTNANVAVAHYVSGGWQETLPSGNFNADIPPLLEAILNTISGTVYSGLLSSLSPFTIGWGNPGILPLQITRFTAGYRQGAALLDWTVTDAVLAQGFEVEYSTTASRFTTVGKVLPGAGKHYQFQFPLPAGSEHFVRLKVVQKTGQVLYSSIQKIAVPHAATYITGVVQNPVQGGELRVKIFSQSLQAANFIIRDMSGRTLHQAKQVVAKGDNILPLNIQHIPAGMYMLSIFTADGTSKTFSFLH